MAPTRFRCGIPHALGERKRSLKEGARGETHLSPLFPPAREVEHGGAGRLGGGRGGEARGKKKQAVGEAYPSHASPVALFIQPRVVGRLLSRNLCHAKAVDSSALRVCLMPRTDILPLTVGLFVVSSLTVKLIPPDEGGALPPGQVEAVGPGGRDSAWIG